MNAILQPRLILPGYLYAKVLKHGNPPGNEFQLFFAHPLLSRFQPKIDELRQSFSWQPGSCTENPVVVMLSDDQGTNVLVVRFSDDGKDSFGRPGTLRLDAFLAPEHDARSLADGQFEAVPDIETKSFLVVPSGQSVFHDNARHAVFGKFGTFSMLSAGLAARTLEPVPNLQSKNRKGLFALVGLAGVSLLILLASLLLFFKTDPALRGDNQNLRSKVQDLEQLNRSLSEKASILESQTNKLQQGLSIVNHQRSADFESYQHFYRELKDLVNRAPDATARTENDTHKTGEPARNGGMESDTK